ncbi:MAG: hypothetical protein ISS15_03770 [Alphaproteobacteria bacterium]|nr:hypothetical protein [Alphaproteobacteria bacterium]MBL6939238.1 hypothetical protein [Alphaproteobacteria bacterium]MBL7096754.1 hypothetical protein [Alphaproteobacteria bacterium]
MSRSTSTHQHLPGDRAPRIVGAVEQKDERHEPQSEQRQLECAGATMAEAASKP